MFDANHIVQTGGLLIITLIIFAESGLLLGIVLPGDSLLLAAGVFAAKGQLDIGWLVFCVVVAAIIGYEVGYSIGKRFGPRLFKRDDGFLFRKEYMDKTEEFFKKYGPVTLVAARFIANVRTVVSAVAGASNMNHRSYTTFNIIGAVLWGAGLTLAGYWLGTKVPNIDKYIVPLLVIALVIFYAVTFWSLTRSPERRHNLKKGLKEDWHYYFRRQKS